MLLFTPIITYDVITDSCFMHLTNIFMQLLFTTTAVHVVFHLLSSKKDKKNLFFYIMKVNYDQVPLGIQKRQRQQKAP